MSKDDQESLKAVRIEYHSAPIDYGTEVLIAYEREGRLRQSLSKWLGLNLEEEIAESFRIFKALVETGEVATIKGQSSGRDQEEEDSSDENSGGPRRKVDEALVGSVVP